MVAGQADRRSARRPARRTRQARRRSPRDRRGTTARRPPPPRQPRSPPRRRGGFRGCRCRWRPAWRSVYSVPRRLRLPAVLRRRAGRGGGGGAAPAAEGAVPRGPGGARAYFSAAELEKADRFRSGQLWLYGGRTVVELARAGRRRAARAARLAPAPVLTGAADRGGDHRWPPPPWRCRCARPRASAPRTSAWSRRAGAAGPSTWPRARRSAACWRARAARCWSSACAASAATGGRRAPPPSSPSRVVFTYLGPVVLDPRLQQVHAAAGGSDPRTTCWSSPSAPGVDVGEVYEVDASRRTTAANAYVTGLGHTKRVVLYDTLLKDFTPAETRLVIAHELGHVHFRDVPHGPAVARARRAVRDAGDRPRVGAADARGHDRRSPPWRSRSPRSRRP